MAAILAAMSPRPTRLSAGVVVIRETHEGWLYLLLRAYNHWDFPKGMVEPGEEPLAAAIREFVEEIGTTPTGHFHALTPVRQKGGKVVHAWAVEGDCEPTSIISNNVTIEWPPRSGQRPS